MTDEISIENKEQLRHTQLMQLLKLDYYPRSYPEDYKPDYGVGALYYTPAIRGKSSIDNKKLLEYILDPKNNVKSEITDPHDIQYQDLVLPHEENSTLPVNKEAAQLVKEMMESASILTHMPTYSLGPMWAIVHDYQHQTYPHSHYPTGLDLSHKIPLAGVYWVSVPEGSSDLEFYPTGTVNELTAHVKPVEGDFIIFPSDLLHGVRQNGNKDEPRVSVSFNMISSNIPAEFMNAKVIR